MSCFSNPVIYTTINNSKNSWKKWEHGHLIKMYLEIQTLWSAQMVKITISQQSLLCPLIHHRIRQKARNFWSKPPPGCWWMQDSRTQLRFSTKSALTWNVLSEYIDKAKYKTDFKEQSLPLHYLQKQTIKNVSTVGNLTQMKHGSLATN